MRKTREPAQRKPDLMSPEVCQPADTSTKWRTRKKRSPPQPESDGGPAKVAKTIGTGESEMGLPSSSGAVPDPLTVALETKYVLTFSIESYF